MILDRFYPIVDSADLGRAARRRRRAADPIAHEGQGPSDDRERDARGVGDLPRGRRALVVNDYWRVAIDEGAPCVHLGQGDLDGADIGAIRARGLQARDQHPRRSRTRARAGAGARLRRARPDLSDDPEGDGASRRRAWRASANGSGASARSRWSRSAASTSSAAVACLAAGADVVSVVTDITLNADPEGRAREWIAATRAP